MADAANSPTGLEVAVIGMACRVPGAANVREFWRNLREGVESITFLTREELEATGESPAVLDLPNYVPVGRLLDDVESFDAPFFGCSPREAELLDPQQRLLLECAWAALESAGYDSESYPGLVGVYAGAKMNGYLWNLYSNPAILQSVGDIQVQIGNEKDYVATRVSYKLGLGGPSVTVQSACSTSLVAIHFACQGLLAGECDMALAGGIAIRVPHRTGHVFREGEILSPDGHCRAFDAKAQGTIFGNGMGMVVLKRLEDALADGDLVRAVIKGSAMNNDGALKVGYTAPGVDGQMRVVRAAQLTARVEPESITYVEAHGTGTLLGDPIEVKALTQAFRARTEKRGFCALGSVKTNIGHLGTAAGVAGFIKTVLALEHRALPPSLLYEEPNPQIDFAASPFYVNTRFAPWETDGSPRRAGVSAFGIGGTNAHVIVEEAPPAEPSGPSRPWQLLVLSAKTGSALDAVTANLRRHLEEIPEAGPAAALPPLADVAYTLKVGRRPLEHRRVVVCRDLADAVDALGALDPKQVVSGTPETKAPPVAFLFSGQGAQHVGMACELYREEAVFRTEVDRSADLLLPHLGLDLRDVLYPAPERAAEAARRLDRTDLTQPALFVVEYALARLWMSWGVKPQAMLGHSVGEYVAACLAGVFPLDAALALVAARGRLMEGLPGGAMLAVPLPEAEVQGLLGRQLALAAVNGPGRAVVSGPEEAVEALARRFAERGVACRRLHTSHAFHSEMMEPILGAFLEQVAAVPLEAPQVPYLSNVTGGWIRAEEATDPAYWVRHLRGTVRFGDGLGELCKDRQRVLLEVGPSQTLVALARQHPDRGHARVIVPSLPHPKDRQSDLAVLLRGLGQLWLAGVAPDWTAFYAGERRRRVALPTYPFERRRYWIEPGQGAFAAVDAQAALRRKADVADWFYLPYWKPSAPPLPLAAGNGAVHRWLIFADGCGLGAALAERLRRAGHEAATVVAGGRFSRTGPGAYELDPGSRDDYDALLADLRESGGLPGAVAHLWSVSREAGTAPYEATQQRGFYSLLHLAQALGRQSLPEQVHLGVVGNGLHRVLGDEEVCPEKATVLGPVKVVPQEYPRLTCSAVDVVLPPAGAALGALADALLAELAHPAPERVVAYRGGRRWVQEWDAVRVDQAVAEALGLRRQGVYLITGGLGGLGLVFADYLAREFAARLVLVGRSALPPRQEWEARLAAPDVEDGLRQRLGKLLALEAAGAEVMVASADVADEAAVAAVVAAARRRFGAIHGAIHAAGVAGGGIIQLKTVETAEKVLAPKVRGARALAAALAGEPLDLFLLCSSTIGVFGGFGQVDYCGANCFLDAFAHAAPLPGARVVSINWGAWDEVGMAVNTPLPRGLGGPAAAVAPRASAAPVAPAPPARPLHPLLDRCLEAGPERSVFSTWFSPERHWLLAEHRILGTGAIPGTAYLEIARAAREHATGEAAAEVREVVFFTPVMVPDGETREVRTTLERDGDAHRFRIESREDQNAGWQEHARGRVGATAAGPPATYPLAEIQARCPARELAGELVLAGGKMVSWGPRWQSLQSVGIGDGEGLALLELPVPFAADLEQFGLHPALLDVATALASAIAGEASYLPLSYRRLRAPAPIPRRFFAYLRGRGGTVRNQETFSVDVALLDESGVALVEIEQFTMKRVGEAAGRLQRSAKGGAAAAAQASAPPPLGAGGIRPGEGVEALRRVLSRPLGPQVAVSTRDLTALVRQASAAVRASLAEQVGGAKELAARYPRPDLKSAYVPPGDDVEGRLVEVWQRVLGLESVGIHDNFFELGGDSVMGIQVATKAADAGLEISPEQLFQHQTVAELARAVGSGAATAAAEPAAAALTDLAAARFALARLQPQILERILAEREVEDLYPLSPLQQGLLFHTLAAPEAGLYVEQISATFVGDLDTVAFERAWARAIDHHPVLRTAYLWEDLDRPLQVVSPRVDLPIEREDWRALPAADQAERLAARRLADRGRPFHLAAAPLMRLYLFQIADDAHYLLWSHHHLLMDGWSSPLLVNEVFVIYEVFRRGGDLALAPARPFRDYIRWLEEQDLASAEDFWRGQLADFTRPTPIGADREGDGRQGTAEDYARQEARLSPEATAVLQEVARQNQVTLNSVVQGAWALLLGRAGGERDVVFGASVSSRPAALPGVESMVGLFLNALPVRVRLVPEEPLASWLKGLQDLQRSLLEFAHTPLVEVQRWSEMAADRPLFETVYEFWNFPLRVEGSGSRSFELRDWRYDVVTHYPLSLRVIPGQELVLQLTWDCRRFDAATIACRLRELELVLGAVVAHPGATLGEIAGALDAAERAQKSARAREVAGVAQAKLKSRTRRPGTAAGS
jgi:acyl transferase domain-containing protein